MQAMEKGKIDYFRRLVELTLIPSVSVSIKRILDPSIFMSLVSSGFDTQVNAMKPIELIKK